MVYMVIVITCQCKHWISPLLSLLLYVESSDHCQPLSLTVKHGVRAPSALLAY